ICPSAIYCNDDERALLVFKSEEEKISWRTSISSNPLFYRQLWMDNREVQPNEAYLCVQERYDGYDKKDIRTILRELELAFEESQKEKAPTSAKSDPNALLPALPEEY